MEVNKNFIFKDKAVMEYSHYLACISRQLDSFTFYALQNISEVYLEKLL